MFGGVDLERKVLNRERLTMALTQLAAGTAILAVLTAQAASAQPAPAPPPPDQPAPAQSAPPPPPDQPAPPPPAAAQSAPDQPGPPPPGAPPQPPGPPPQAGGPPPAAVNTNVNLREGPGTNYQIVITIPAGAPVNVGGCSAGWCQVTFQGQNGYIIATSLGAPPPRPYPPGYPPPPPPLYPPPYYGPYPYGYYGPGPYWRHRGYYGGWHRHW